MQMSNISASASMLLNLRPQAGAKAPGDGFPAAQRPANSSGAVTILPPSSPVRFSNDMLLALQGENEDAASALAPPSAADLFLQEARKPPMQRMREAVMKELAVSEDSMAAMSAEERQATEDKIREMIEEKIQQAMGAGQGAPESTAEALSQAMA